MAANDACPSDRCGDVIDATTRTDGFDAPETPADAPRSDADDDATADVSANDATTCDCSGSCVTRACRATCGSADGGSYCPVTHVFDLAEHMPDHLAVMYSMSWFGIPASGDPNGAGSDRGWGNWRWGGGCVSVNNPATCASFMGTSQRSIASRHRPLAGIYSSSGRDAESLRRIDLMLSTLRRSCDSGARIDAWSVQIDSIRFTSRYLDPSASGYADSADLAYRAFVAFLERADAQAMNGVIVPGIDTTWNWHFGDARGLTSQAARLGALEDDLVDMLEIADPHASALRISGRPVLYVYTGGSGTGPYISVAEWTDVLRNVRNRTGLDAYVVGATTNASYFEAFDAISPWIETGAWDASTGSTNYDRARNWTHRRMDSVVSRVDTYPGRVVWGGVAPGFDDYTRNWGACDRERVIPRDDRLIDAQLDVMTDYRAAGHAMSGMMLETWDDWTEGSVFEPEVGEGTARLVHLRQRIGAYFGEAADADGDARLTTRWEAFGQARDCNGGSVSAGAAIDLRCP
jgi:hypothetical protein